MKRVQTDTAISEKSQPNNTPVEGKDSKNSTIRKQVIGLVAFAVIGISLPVTMLLVNQRQDVRQRAAETTAINPSGCLQQNEAVDINKDGVITQDDIKIISSNFLVGGNGTALTPDQQKMDLDGDGKITTLDLAQVSARFGQKLCTVKCFTQGDPIDINGDGVINQADLELISSNFLKSASSSPDLKRMDIDGDGQITTLDLAKISQHNLETICTSPTPIPILKCFQAGDPIDVNKDGVISQADLELISSNFLAGSGGTTLTSDQKKTDINNDGTISVLDLSIVGSNFGESACQISSTPTPSKTVKVPPCFPTGISTGYGDLDSNNIVDDNDAGYLGDIVLGKKPASQTQNLIGDVNKSGTLTMSDALLIAQFAENKIPTLPACSNPTPTQSPTSTPISQPTPTAQASGFKGEYYSNRSFSGAPILTRFDPSINFNWGYSSPVSGIPIDNFSIRWTKNQYFDQGTYKFTIKNDDGMKVSIDGRTYYNHQFSPGSQGASFIVNLTQGNHPIIVSYNENTGKALAQFSWEKIR